MLGDLIGFDEGRFSLGDIGLNAQRSAAFAEVGDDIVVTANRVSTEGRGFFMGWDVAGYSSVRPMENHPGAALGIETRRWFQEHLPLVRLGGAVQGVFGTVEAAGGAIMAGTGVVTSEFGFGIPLAAGGALITWNGYENARAGFGTMWTGQPQRTALQDGLTALDVPQWLQGPIEVLATGGASAPAVMARTGVRTAARSALTDVTDLTPRVNVADEFTEFSTGSSARSYQYMNPDAGHGLAVFVDGDGVAGFDLAALGDRARYGGGRDMMLSAMQRMEADGVNVTQIRGMWLREGRSDNFAEFTTNVSTMSRSNAAANTWTGRFAANMGYTQVSEPLVTPSSVMVYFTKPRTN